MSFIWLGEKNLLKYLLLGHFFTKQKDDYPLQKPRISLHQIDCDRDPVPDCTDLASLPAIVAFRGHEVVASYDPEEEKARGYGDKRKGLTYGYDSLKRFDLFIFIMKLG